MDFTIILVNPDGEDMPKKHNQDALPRDKLLVLYQRLTLDGRKHFQSDIADDLGCSGQTVTRLIGVIERHLGKDTFIESDIENRRRYYRLRSKAEEKALGFRSRSCTTSLPAVIWLPLFCRRVSVSGSAAA